MTEKNDIAILYLYFIMSVAVSCCLYNELIERDLLYELAQGI
jgi:hypothetical protein